MNALIDLYNNLFQSFIPIFIIFIAIGLFLLLFSLPLEIYHFLSASISVKDSINTTNNSRCIYCGTSRTQSDSYCSECGNKYEKTT